MKPSCFTPDALQAGKIDIATFREVLPMIRTRRLDLPHRHSTMRPKAPDSPRPAGKNPRQEAPVADLPDFCLAENERRKNQLVPHTQQGAWHSCIHQILRSWIYQILMKKEAGKNAPEKHASPGAVC